MPPSKESATKEWLVKAEHDIRAAEVLLTAERLPDVAVYHCQQGAEKALKAFLFYHDVTFRKTHDLAELGEACAQLDSSLASVIDQAIDLTPFAWQFRYPAENRGDPTVEDAREAITVARVTYEAICSRLPAV